MITEDTRLKIVELRSQGRSIEKIAKATKVAKQTVVDVCKEMQEEIAALHAVRLDALYEEAKVGAEERVLLLSTLLGKIRKELEQRSLADVPTEKLVDMLLKTEASLKEAIIEPVFKSSEEQKQEKEERSLLQTLT